MDAVTYVKERRRICHEHSVCAECPLRKFDDCYNADPEELVKAVEEWSTEHSIMTNGEVAVSMMMKKMDAPYIQCTKNEAGQVEMLVDASWWDAEYKGAE